MMKNFKKCDFHIHSTSSDGGVDCGKDKSIFINKFIDKVISENIDYVSITDHNLFDYDLFLLLKKKLNEKNKDIFPGIELDLFINEDTISKNNLIVSEKKFHSILIFSEKDIEKFISKFSSVRNYGNLEYKLYDLFEIFEELSEIDYYFIPHSGGKTRSIDEYLKNDNENNKKFKRKLTFFNLPNYGLDTKDQNNVVNNFFTTNYSSVIPHFEFSDAHYVSVKTKEQEKSYVGEYFSWINFDGSFEDLKMCFSDPESRIVLGSQSTTNPQENLDKYLEEVSFKLKGENFNLKFSPGINSIIGQKGSGKTMLGSILSRNSKSLEKYDQYKISDIKFKVSNRNEWTESLNLDVLFITQDYFDSITLQKNSEDKINKIKFLSDIKVNFNNERNQINEFYKQKIDNCKKNIIYYINLFRQKNFSYEQIDLTADSSGEISIFSVNSLTTQDVFLDNIQSDKKILNDISSSKSKIEMKTNLQEYYDLEKKYNAYIPEIINDSNRILNSELSISSKEKIKFHENNKIIKELFLTEIEKTNNFLKNRTNDFNKNIEIFEWMILIKYKIKEILENIDKITYNYFNKISNLKDDFDDFGISKSNTEIYISSSSISYDDNEDSIFNMENDYLLSKNSILDFINSSLLLTNSKMIRKAHSEEEFSQIIEGIFNNFLLSITNKTIFELDFGIFTPEKEKMSYKNMSPGKIASTLWKIIFEYEIPKEKYDLIILDQPEDNLDMKTIRETIIEMIRKLKKNTQFFLISHNSSIVVNSDSDNIILSKQNIQDKIEYEWPIKTYHDKSTALDLLDGGEKFFMDRKKKYNIEGNKAKYENRSE